METPVVNNFYELDSVSAILKPVFTAVQIFSKAQVTLINIALIFAFKLSFCNHRSEIASTAWRGREIFAPESLMRLFWSPNPLPSFHRSSYCVPSFNLSIATQEDDPPCRPSAQARASKLMMKMCQQRALSRQILLLQYIS